MTNEGGWCWPRAGGLGVNPKALVLPCPQLYFFFLFPRPLPFAASSLATLTLVFTGEDTASWEGAGVDEN